ncbi:glycosyl transferase family 2 protein [Alcanivorax sp. 521-1]|uniref:Glycosyl transferase family 2 protein n=1 Tax=Alloalcanivorax profundimaris TaxID=2735259 RepID=A0ABS0APL7_9GAMM|nr:glycosyltransferase family A protein [Alloalcanivorax profundimaris]MBF5056071.1 glycosyl transferase family 2 protein [Alloalcanivorax profundimaris]
MPVDQEERTAAQISIIMPLYNKENLVLSSIASVQAQTFGNWELVVIDDGSTDAGADQVAALDDRRIRLIRQANGGVSAARNRGIAEASCELLAFLDADDIWLPGYLSAILALAADFPKARWFATSYLIHHPRDGEYQARLRGVPAGFRRGLLADYFAVAALSDPPVNSSVVSIYRTEIQRIGGFPEGIDSGEDLLTWARLAARLPLAYDTRALAVFEVSGIERRPDAAQRVGTALSELKDQFPQDKALRSYLGLWNRMQSVMAMRFDDMTLARRCAWRAFISAPQHWRNAYVLCLSLLPRPLRNAVDVFLRRLISS